MKKLPFKPTALRRPSVPRPASGEDDAKPDAKPDADDDGLALFRRSKEMEPIMAADRERRLKKRQRQDDERRRQSLLLAESAREEDHCGPSPRTDSFDQPPSAPPPSTPVVDLSGPGDEEDSTRDLVTPPASKRSRTESTPSSAPPPPLSDEAGVAAGDSPSSRRDRSQLHLETASSSYPAVAAAPPSAQPVSLDSDDDDEDGDEDDEFGEYVRKAQEQRARDRAMLGQGEDRRKGRETVDILVTSFVPNAKPCCVKFLFDKPLRVVRNSWAALQRQNGVQLGVQHDDDVVLTWRRQKVYTVSTLLNLGIQPQGDGRIRVDEGRGGEGLASNRTRVHLEAWTPDLFREMELREELRRKREAGEASGSDDDDAAAAGGPLPAPEVKIRVTLKARGFDDVKLTVRPETTVETLVTGFRAQRRIGSDRAVAVVFEGERLDEHVTMEEADIADLDLIDVHVR